MILGVILILIIVANIVSNKQNGKRSLSLDTVSRFVLSGIRKTRVGKEIFQKSVNAMRILYVRENAEEKATIFCTKQITLITLVLLASNSLSIIVALTGSSLLYQSYYLKRPGYGESALSVPLYMQVEENQEEIELELQERQYTDPVKLKEIFDKAKQYLDNTILGNNEAYDHIDRSLCLVTKIPSLSVTVDWELGYDGCINQDGSITVEDYQRDGVIQTITAVIRYYDNEIRYPINLVLYPKEKTKTERLIELVQQEVRQQQQSAPEEEYLKLPKTIEGQELIYYERKEKDPILLTMLGLMAMGCLLYGNTARLEKEKKKRDRQMLLDYPDIIHKLVLLLGAGMTVKNAWGMICGEYERKRQRAGTRQKAGTKEETRYIYEEMVVTIHEIQNGMAEMEAYDRFGRRVKLIPYMKLSSLLVQNMTKGTGDLLKLLEYEAVQSFEERKDMAKRVGEEASTKLLVPMVFMLLILLIIIMVPAFMQM
ncbi:hypothetical protein [Anaerosporobacter faecicola]|uniref:hypothetical protein n=1 Tax=Anaerosporobacter faecicola TaxID=2718714 RepID=UPI00143C48C8|nr:hypothetical protein [Anaerosporobacter faecicola]